MENIEEQAPNSAAAETESTSPEAGPLTEKDDTAKSGPTKRKMYGIGMLVCAAILILSIVAAFFVIRGKQVESVTLNKSSLETKVGESAPLTFVINPEDAKDQTVTWSSSNESIARVNEGTVTGLNEGECIVTISSSNGKTDTCNVTVLPAGPDLKELYNSFCSSYFAQVADDGSYLLIDTNPLDVDDYSDEDALLAILLVNNELELPESVISKMSRTRALDGTQSHETDDLEISWTYHPNNGLEVLYSLK